MKIELEDYTRYWSDLYPNKSDPSGYFLFEIKRGDAREEFYYTDNDQIDYESYALDNEENLLDKKKLTQKEILKIIKENFKEYWGSNVNVEMTDFTSQIDRSFESNYIRHKMYVAGDYYSIVKIILDTLSDKEYYHYSLEEDRAVKIQSTNYLQKNELSPFSFSITSFMYRTECSEGYPGCMISVNNIPARLSTLENLREPIYDWVFDRLEDIPCTVEFDFNFKSYFSRGKSVYNYYVTPFYLNLIKNNIRSLLFSIDDQVFYIKTNPLLNESERLIQIDLLTGRAIDPEYVGKLEIKAKKLLGKYWDELSQVTRLSMMRGLEEFETDRIYNGDILDSSPASIQFAKCIETEIEQKLLLPFRNYFNSSGYGNLDPSPDLRDNMVARMITFLITPSSKAPELGTFAFFLSKNITKGSRTTSSNTVKAYLEHIQSYQNPDFLKSIEFQEMLNLITTKYRNGAAHTKALSYAHLLEFYNKLFGTDQNGFLFKLLNAMKHK